jgi:hypothetical protein
VATLALALSALAQNFPPAIPPRQRPVGEQYGTTPVLTSRPDPSIYGQPVTFTATVRAAGPKPTGKVTFRNGTTSLGSASLVNGVAKITESNLPKTTNRITAVYHGDSVYPKSTSEVLSQVVK